ncbi:Fc.00g111670.m01.CDS01 [Cosmosporella sp. VM-42]
MTAATATVSFSTGVEASPGQTHRRQTSASITLAKDRLVEDSPPSPSLHSHRQSHNSSKLPAFRFADLNKTTGSPTALSQLSHPSLAPSNGVGDQAQAEAQAHTHAPPSPVSPNTVPAGGSPSADPGGPIAVLNLSNPVTGQNPQSTTHHHSEKQAVSASASASASPSAAALTSTPASTAPTITSTTSASITSPSQPPSRSRASTLQPSPTPVPVDLPTQAKRPASFPDAQPAGDVVAQSPHSTSAAAKSRTRRSLVSRRSNVAAASTGPPPALNLERLQAVEAAESAQSSDKSTKDSPQGQRELILPKTLSNSSPTDEKRTSISHRPPVSFRPPLNNNTTTSTPVRVPPIRGFRSSGSRKSLTLDMNSRSRFYDMGDDLTDSNHDRTLRALEGRSDQDFMHNTPPVSSRHDALDGDDTGDVFLKIAREEQNRRLDDESFPDESQSIVSRVMRSSHRRPLSSTVPTYTPTSPPRIPRRLSDQQESSRPPRRYEEDRASEVSRFSNYRSLSRDKAASVHPAEEGGRTRANVTASRTAPVTPRSQVFQESEGSNSVYARRRSSITDSNATVHARNSAYKAPGFGHAQTKSYNSSPLVKSFDFPRTQAPEVTHGREGTESTTSNTAPSTVWDELDDLKSRIHRLELTGKMPSTSGAAMSRLSDERPPTATTTATTMSSSPKRLGGGPQSQPADTASTTSAHREAHPILHAALSKSKPLLDAEVYRALEAAANDAMGLSSMMGTPGQPGPISSGASTIGSGTTITDRQLRRKADSVCRSLTELCLALGEDSGNSRSNQVVHQVTQAYATPPSETPTTPTVVKSFNASTAQRRPSVATEQTVARSNTTTSPRAMSKFEERRINLLTAGNLPNPRTTNPTPAPPLEPPAHRRSSLMVARSRRATTEEPEEGRKSSLLRSRRAGTEEPDEGRKTSLLVRSRRNTVGEEEDESRFRAPSRAQTDLSIAGRLAHDHQPSQTLAPDSSSLATSALPRRRFVSSSLNTSRLATPMTSNVTPPRRYLERSTPDRDGNSVVDKLAEDRGHRHMSLGQTMLVNRNPSVNRRAHRDSIIPTLPASNTAGGYR